MSRAGCMHRAAPCRCLRTATFHNRFLFNSMVVRYQRTNGRDGAWFFDDRGTKAANDLSFLKALLFVYSNSILDVINMVTLGHHHYFEKKVGALLPIVTGVFGYLGVDFNESDEVGGELVY